jgi:HEAT repeat protein
MFLQSTKSDMPFSLNRERLALILLVGQSFFLGYGFALLYTVANALFLLDYGSDFIPYTFLAIAVVVPLFSFAFSSLQKRWPLTLLGFVTIAFFTILFFIARMGLELPGSRWPSFALLVAFTLGSLLCGIVRGAQAGFLFDARTLKQVYPLIVGGEILGVIAGGISSMFLPRLMGSTQDVLLVAGGSMVLLLVLLVVMNREFRDVLTESKKREPAVQAKVSLGRLVSNRYILLVFLYQILSSMGTRLVYYLFLNQAEVYFKTPEALTSFFGTAMAVVTVLTLLFVVFLSGRLLTRYGMGLGLAGNPVGVGVAVVAAAVVGTFFGSGTSLFFWLVLCSGLFDMILTSGLTDTTVQSTYQPLPPAERTAVRTLVEGVGIPVAYGLSGVCLLLFNLMRRRGLVPVVYFTLGVAVLWTLASLVLYRRYSDRLRQSVRRRWLDQDVVLKDRSSLRVVESLLESSEAKEVTLALELLEKAEHPSLTAHLLEALHHPRPEVRTFALASIERGKVAGALEAIRGLLRTATSAGVKAAAVRALCALQGDEVEETLSFLDDADQEVRIAALVGLFRYGGIGGVAAALGRFNEMGASADPARKVLLARVLGQIGERSFYQPLLPLLSDGSPEVRREALLSAGKVAHPRLLPPVIDNLKVSATRSEAISTLVVFGGHLLPILEESLFGKAPYDKETVVRLIRSCSMSRSDETVAFLEKLIAHPDDDIQWEALKGLNLCGYRASEGNREQVEKVLFGQVEHALRALLARQDLGKEKDFALLGSALDGELGDRRKRTFLLLSFLYDAQAIMGAERKLSSGIKAQVGLAIELLDVTLDKKTKRIVFPLVDENTPLAKRIAELKALVGLGNLSPEERLREIITDEAAWRSSWTRACAIHAAAVSGGQALAGEVEGALRIADHPVRETAAWALQRLDPDAYRRHVERLREDPNPQVARLARELTA